MAYDAADTMMLMVASHLKAYRLLYETRGEPSQPLNPPEVDRSKVHYQRPASGRDVLGRVKTKDDEDHPTRPVLDYGHSIVLRRNDQTRPYTGEMGPQSFKAWQMEDYYICRSFVNEFVDDILLKLVTPTAASVPVNMLPRSHLSEASIMQIVQLIADEILFEVTDQISAAVVLPFANVSHEVNMYLARLVQMAADKTDDNVPGGTADGLTFADSALAQRQRERTQQGNDVWAHSSTFSTNFEPRKNATSDPEDEIDALDFNELSAVGSQPVDGSYQQPQDAVKMNDYRKQEANYMSSR